MFVTTNILSSLTQGGVRKGKGWTPVFERFEKRTAKRMEEIFMDSLGIQGFGERLVKRTPLKEITLAGGGGSVEAGAAGNTELATPIEEAREKNARLNSSEETVSARQRKGGRMMNAVKICQTSGLPNKKEENWQDTWRNQNKRSVTNA